MKPLLIEIEQEIPGFKNFIGAWVCQGDMNIIFDVGPANSVSRLVDLLVSAGISRIDYIILTHIHIDHAGGLAGLIEHFPMAKVVCHAGGIRHLVDTSKLWSGSCDTLGSIADSLGRPKPVNEEKFIRHTDVNIHDMQIIETPGHAAHHLSFLYKGILFSGEAAGNYFIFNSHEYMRPATPPRLFLNKFLESVDRLIALGDRRICYAHFGESESSLDMLLRFKEQVIRWKETIKEEMAAGSQGIIKRCTEKLIQNDPELEAFEILEPVIQVRERNFISNSIEGFVSFIKES